MATRLFEQTNATGCVDVSKLVYVAHLGLIDDAYDAAESACLGRVGGDYDVVAPDGYRTLMLCQAGLPEIRQDPRLSWALRTPGLVEFWLATGAWPVCVDEVPCHFKAECEKASHIPTDEFAY